jgi:FtsP/CotA-like multicopper oxidase with cupredoxin domain
MATLTAVALTIAGVNPAPAAASIGGDEVANPSGKVVLRVANAGASPITVTIEQGDYPVRPADGTYPAMELAAQTVAVPAGGARLIGPIPPAYNDSDGMVQITYDESADVTIEAFKLP